jgi:Fe2+ or Zn2+ uptake regulation protein
LFNFEKFGKGEQGMKEKEKWHKTHFVCPRCKKIILVEYKSKELIDNWYVH